MRPGAGLVFSKAPSLDALHQRCYPEYRAGPKNLESELLSSSHHSVQTHTPREQDEDELQSLPWCIHTLASPEDTLWSSLGESVYLLRRKRLQYVDHRQEPKLKSDDMDNKDKAISNAVLLATKQCSAGTISQGTHAEALRRVPQCPVLRARLLLRPAASAW